MIAVRRAHERGQADHGWLQAQHTFSFGTYRDPNAMGFRTLRVMNEDRVAPGAGFGLHPHRDMEIVTHIIDGSLRHMDSLGNTSVLSAGDFQRMTAGTGIEHSEVNASSDSPVHLYQVWIRPGRAGLKPSYEELDDPLASSAGLRLIASRDGRDGSMLIHQNAEIHAGHLEPGEVASHTVGHDRGIWVQVVRGEVVVNGMSLSVGDGAAADGVDSVELLGGDAGATVMLFDL